MEPVTIEDRVTALEREVRILKAINQAITTGLPPMDRGMALFHEGDAIPSRSVHDLHDGQIWMVTDGNRRREPLRFTKNTSGNHIKAGELFGDGRVDTQLRHPSVAPNNFFWLEIA